MTFHDCEETICENLSQYLQALLKEKSFSVSALREEHDLLIRRSGDEYSRALLLQGISRTDTPIFANYPSSNFKWEIRNNLTLVFEALGLPDTQQQAYRFSGWLMKKNVNIVLSPTQKHQLEELDFIQRMFKDTANWCNKARKEIDAMKANLPLLANVTEEEKEFSNSLQFNWYYSYCDDITGWRAGNEKHRKVAEQVRATLLVKPHLEKVVQTVAIAHGFRSDFFINPS